MDTFVALMSEIQSLRKDVVSLREQNMMLFNELAHQHKILNDAIDFSNSNHLKFHLPRLVGMQTAEFIIKNMNKVKFIDDKTEYLRYLLAQTANALGGGRIFGIRCL